MPEAPGLAETVSASEKLTLGPRLAGGGLLALASLSLVEYAGFPELFGQGLLQRAQVAWTLDLFVGLALVAGYGPALVLAIIRVVLGALVFGAFFVAESNWYALALQGVAAGGLLLLLHGAPPRRVVAGLALFVLAFAGELVGYVSLKTGTFPVLPIIQAGSLEAIEGDTVEGVDADYSLTLPDARWRRRSAAAAARDNPLADQWLSLPIHDAHLLVMARPIVEGADLDLYRVEGAELDLYRVGAAIVGEMTRQQPSLRIGDWAGHRGDHILGVSARGAGTVGRQRLEFRFLVAAQGNNVYVLLAAAPATAVEHVEADFEALFASFDPR